MAPRSRLTLLFAASIAMLATTAPAFAQAGSTVAPSVQAPGNGDSESAQPPPSERQPVAPSGCPYRDGKLELIV